MRLDRTDKRAYALIGSALRSAPELLQQVMDACQRMSIAPQLAEPNAQRQIEQAGLFIGVYPEQPTPETLAEYSLAAARNIPRLIFVRDDLPERDALIGLRAAPELIRFGTAEQLRAALINRLAALRDLKLESLHYVGAIPTPPEVYIAHPYTLLPSRQMIGRRLQLEVLSDWITERDHKVRLMNVVAIGGMGKSAMTWHWFSEIAPSLADFRGRMWWSFYESDAYFENFVIRALAYVTGSPEAEIREISAAERERELLEILDREPFLITLDGLERILIAYARMDAARMDDDSLDEETANVVAGALGIPKEAQGTIFTPNRLRKTADPRAGAFLRKLASVNASRILISTRLYPADLQHSSGYPILGSFAMFLSGLEDAEALALWRAYGCSGEDAELLPIFNAVQNYPLLIRALAGEVVASAQGDFAAWRRANSGFAPLRQSADAVRAHVMSYALRSLSAGARRTLETIAAFRMPTFYESLVPLLVKSVEAPEETDRSSSLGSILSNLLGRRQPEAFSGFASEAELDAALTDLEARGLVGWDKRANRYDLHPIVRGVVWNALDAQAQQGLYAALNAHFSAMPAVRLEDVRSLDDLTPSIELYNTLIGMGKYDEAYALYDARLNVPMLRRLSANLQRAELLEQLFPDGTERAPRLSTKIAQARAINDLALAYQMSGQPTRAAPLFLRAVNMAEYEGVPRNVAIGLMNFAEALRQVGDLYPAAMAANRALLIARAVNNLSDEVTALGVVALTRMAHGAYADAETALQRAIRLQMSLNHPQGLSVLYAFLAQLAVWRGEVEQARQHADQAWHYAQTLHYEADLVRARRFQGEALLLAGDLSGAEAAFIETLARARAASLTEHELGAVIGLAAVRLRAGMAEQARTTLEDVWEAAERGGFRLAQADALNVLASAEIAIERYQAAVQAAQAAVQMAWCMSEPYTYAHGMAQARATLNALGAPLPEGLPTVDFAQFGKAIEVELDPPQA
jgi:tetratricopeptide (TPR) repeat protein